MISTKPSVVGLRVAAAHSDAYRVALRARARSTTLLALLALLAIVSVWAPPPAHAVCTTQPDLVTAMQRADTVFIGRVATVEDLNRVVTMDVREVWKGRDLPAQVVVSGAISGLPRVTADDRTYLPGQTYIVVPLGSRSPYLDDACSGTRLFPPSGGNIPALYQDAIGTAVARFPGGANIAEPEAPGGGLNLALAGGGALALVVVSGIVLGWRKRRRPRAEAVAGPPSSQGARPTAGKKGKGKRTAFRPEVDTRTPTPAAAKRGRTKRKAAGRAAMRAASTKDEASGARFSRSGLSNLETMRKKTRRIKCRK